jgi:hypothetical protein
VLKVLRKPADAHEPVAQNGTLDMIRYAARIASSLTGERFLRMQESRERPQCPDSTDFRAAVVDDASL